MVERSPEKAGVGGSIPSLATIAILSAAKGLMPDHQVILYSRQGCHLCDVVKESLTRLARGGGFVWRGLHSLTANLSLVLIGAHVALHWRWILETIKRYVFRPFLPKRSAGVGLIHKEARS